MGKYRPSQRQPLEGKGSRDSHSYRPKGGRYRSRHATPLPREETRGLSPVRTAVKKTKHERHSNPSTRIHSLRNQLGRDEMPMKVRQDKERELAALLLDQQKAQLAQAARKNLQRYHFVRFVERQKATRILKKLLERRVAGQDRDEIYKEKLEKLIHDAEVDLNYTKYAPLGDKYISLFVQEDAEKEKGRNKPDMNKKEYAILDPEQKEELRTFQDELSNVARTAAGTKPPMWYEVEKCMVEGEAKLEALREGKLNTANKLKKELATVGGKEDATARNAKELPDEEARPSWLDDDGIIDPADLDSDQDDDMSDGGFFER